MNLEEILEWARRDSESVRKWYETPNEFLRDLEALGGTKRDASIDERGTESRVTVRRYPELPGPERRECLVELNVAGAGLKYLAAYNEVAERWFVSGEPDMCVGPEAVTRWVYVDEVLPNETRR